MPSEFEPLTHDAIRLLRIHGVEAVQQPILQVLSFKAVSTSATTGQPTRFRAILSDGMTFMQTMFATHLNEQIDNGLIVKHGIVRLDDFLIQNVKDKTLIIVNAIEMISVHDSKIGEPASIESVMAAEATRSDPASQGDAKPAFANSRGNNNNNNNNGNAGMRGGAAANRGGAARPNNNNQQNHNNGIQHPIYPIEGLSPYQNKWTIKARVTNKSDIRHWSNQKGEGKLFSCTFMDDTGEIRATGFNDTVDAFYNLLEEGKVYFLSKARIGIAKKQFNNVNNEYEITLENSTEISLCTDTENVPQVKFQFVQLSDLEQVEPNAMIDVLGIIKEVGDVTQITSKATQRPITKRELTIVDMSGMSVRMTLWGRQAENFAATGEDGYAPLIAFKGVKVGDFGGRSLSMMSSSSMMPDPDITEAHELRGWYDSSGANTSFAAYTNNFAGGAGGQTSLRPENYRLIGEAKDDMLGTKDEPDFFAVRGQIVYIKKENLSYPACPTDKCNKKVQQEDNDVWRCEKCERTYPAPEYRYVLSAQLADFTGFLYISGFNEVGQLLLGKTADEMENLRSTDEAAFNAAVDRAMGNTWNMSIKAKSESYNDQQKIRYQILKAAPVSWSGEEGQRLLDTIGSYDA